MNCEICASDVFTDSVLWTCAGCPRKFHAACVGVNVQRSSLRKKDRKAVDSTSYILPCCESCQELFQAKLDFNHLHQQQKLLTEQLHANTEVVHRLNLQQEQQNMVTEAFEGLEILMSSIRNELSAINKASSLPGSVSAIKNHVTTVLDLMTLKSNECLTKSLQSVTTELSTELRSISNSICEINQLQLDMAATSSMSTNPNLFVDIVDELKAWSARYMAPISAEHNSPSSIESCSSLEAELNSVLQNQNDKINEKKVVHKKVVQKTDTANTDSSGWRKLGLKDVWKASWVEYDARQRRRLEQQKQAEKARRRRKRNVTRANEPRRTVFGNRKREHNNREEIQHRNCVMNHTKQNYLPPDRELLAAAKHQFSRDTLNFHHLERPTNSRHTTSRLPTNYPVIEFRKGETLNPYSDIHCHKSCVPVNSTNWGYPSTSNASCESCGCTRNSSFQRN